jgi:hypothetical protein
VAEVVSATEDEVAEAAGQAAELVERLFAECGGNSGRGAFVLCTALTLLHGVCPSEGRAFIEERIRRMLAQMYKQPPTIIDPDGKVYFEIKKTERPT